MAQAFPQDRNIAIDPPKKSVVAMEIPHNLSGTDFKLLSHPGKLLVEHLYYVLENGRRMMADLPLTGKQRQILEWALALHDMGKATHYFQEYIKAVAEDQKDQGQRKTGVANEYGERKNHAYISALWAHILLRHIFGEHDQAPLIAFFIIRYHHGNLGDWATMSAIPRRDDKTTALKDMNASLDYVEFAHILQVCKLGTQAQRELLNPQTFETQLDNFFHKRAVSAWFEGFKRDPDLFLTVSTMFSVLLACDKGECIFDGLIARRDPEPLPHDLVTRYKQATFGTPSNQGLNGLRERVYRGVLGKAASADIRKQRFYSINLPTGTGKTFTALATALHWVAHCPTLNKIIYCLPFTSVIDQNAEVVQKILKTTNTCDNSHQLSIYHHLSELRYTSPADEIDDYRAEYLISQFESNLNITTFHQLLHGIFTGKNREIRKLSSFAHSVVILDEVQSIPFHYWGLVRNTLQLLAEKLDMVFLLVTATMPLIFDEEEGQMTPLVQQPDQVFAALDRIDLNSDLLSQKMDIPAFAQHLQQQIQPQQKTLIIVNTKKAARQLFEELKDSFEDRLLFLSTDIIPKHRLERIKAIRDSDKPYIVVSTQLVEAGVDIDMDVVYRDIGPLDAVFQAAGRCNRNNQGQKRGQVHIVQLVDKKEDKEEKRRFADFIYGKIDLDASLNALITKTTHPESHFRHLAQAYFQDLKARKSPDQGRHIWEHIGMLDYTKAFDYPREKMAFHLIEARETVPAFVICDQTSRDLKARFEALQECEFLDHFQKKWEFKQLARNMAPFVVSIKGNAHEHATDHHYIWIDKDAPGEFEYHDQWGVQPVQSAVF